MSLTPTLEEGDKPLATGRYTADTVEQDLATAMSEIQHALDKMHGTGNAGAGAASTGGGATAMAAGTSVSAQDVQALDFGTICLVPL